MAKYKTYHGRSRFKWVRLAVPAFLLAGLVSICVFAVPNYISYDADGNMSLELPLVGKVFTPRDPTAPPSPTGPILIVSSPQPEASGSSPSGGPEGPSPSPARLPSAAGKLLFIPASRLSSLPAMTDLRDKALSEGCTGVIVEYKKEGADGETGLTIPPETAASVMEVFRDSGLELTALISACVDNEKPRTGEYTALAVKHTSGSNFLDRNRNRWFDMYKPEVHTLILELCREADGAGFDRILLTNLGFPYLASVDKINYGDVEGKTHMEAVNEFLTKMRAELGDMPLDAVLFPEAARDGREETAGQDAGAFRQAFDRLYVFDGEDGVPPGYIPILQKNDAGFQDKADAARDGYVLYSPKGVY